MGYARARRGRLPGHRHAQRVRERVARKLVRQQAMPGGVLAGVDNKLAGPRST
jgi:hypothetical protein